MNRSVGLRPFSSHNPRVTGRRELPLIINRPSLDLAGRQVIPPHFTHTKMDTILNAVGIQQMSFLMNDPGYNDGNLGCF